MLVIHDPAHVQHNPQYELYDGVKTSYPEVPDRIEVIASVLKEDGHKFIAPRTYREDELLGLHTNDYRNYIKVQSHKTASGVDCYPSNFIHDTYAPITAGTFQAAKNALAIALTGADCLLDGISSAYSLCRPPGHHAGDAYMGGYCYFNNAAAAAQRLSRRGKVAILDIDFHHGNGTQQLFYDRDDVLYVSIHADPSLNYPYSAGHTTETGLNQGTGFNRNIVINQHCGPRVYATALQECLQAVRDFTPDYLVVSLGFDGYKDDPIAGFGLDVQDYQAIARQIAQLHVPTLLVQEGGYNIEMLGVLASTFAGQFN